MKYITNYMVNGVHQHKTENHFVDNEQEAMEFINSGKIKNTTAYMMEMSEYDEEQDCSGLNGSNSMFEFR